MVTLLLGHQGSGKSLMALQYHILVSLAEGRHVYHNIPGIDSVKVSFWFMSNGKLGFTPYYVDSLLHDYSLEHLHELYDDCTDDELGEYYLKEIPNAPQRSLVVLDEAQKTCYVNSKNWNTERNKKFAEYLSIHRKMMHEVLLITQVDGNIDTACRGLCGEVVFLLRMERLGFLGRNKVNCKYYMGHQSVTASAKPYATVSRKYDKSMFDLYSSYTVEGGSEIRRVRNVLVNPKLILFFLAAVFLFARCGPGSVIGKGGRLVDVPALSSSSRLLSSSSSVLSSLSPSAYLGSFVDYHCSDRLYVLRPGGRIDTLPPRSVPAYVCPRYDYVHSEEVVK